LGVGLSAPTPHHGHHGLDGGVAADRRRHRLAEPDDGGEGAVRRGFHRDDEEPGVLFGQEAFRDDEVQPARQRQGADRDREHQAAPAERPPERSIVKEGGGPDRRVPEPRETAGRGGRRGSEELGAHHRGERQRHDHGHHDRDRQGQGELPEHAADDARHEQERDEHRDERDGERDHGEADLARA
jgi:hypothetical protein